QGLEGEYWQEGEGVFIDLKLLFIEGEYDGEVFDIMEVGKIEEESEEGDDEEEEDAEEGGPGFEGGGIYGIDAQSGKILWNYKGFNCRWPIPPVTLIGDGRILITGGYEAATILIQVKYEADKWQVDAIFRNKELQSQIHPAIFYDNHLFMIGNCNQNKNGLTCISLDGNVLWKTGRKPNFDRGSFLIADGKIFIVDGRRGDLYCVKASSQGYQQLGKMKLLKSGKVWSPIALSNGMLVARDQKQILCVKLNLK
ncbi:MAG: PQQ-like beta-propeller repeat protein, partial [Thermoplasmata archaeon]